MSLFLTLQNLLGKSSNDKPISNVSTHLTLPETTFVQSLHMGEKGLQLLEYFEGCRLTAYQDSAGIWTCGYGHTGNVKAGQSINHDQAVSFLAADLKTAEDFIKAHVTVNLMQNQFDALVSFTFNVGVGNFLHSSVLTNVNNSDFDHVPYALSLWNKSGGHVIAGLVTRRHAEGVLFAKNILDFAPVPVPDVRQA